MVFDPARDPFEKDERSSEDPPFRPNAIDLLVTRKVRGAGRFCMSKCLKKRLEKSFVKVLPYHSSVQWLIPWREIVANSY